MCKGVFGQLLCLLFLFYCYLFCFRTEYMLAGLTAEYAGIVLLAVLSAVSLLRRGDRVFCGVDFLFLLFVCWSGWRLATGGGGVDGRAVTRSAGCLLLYFYFRWERPGIFFEGLLFGAGIVRAMLGILQRLSFVPSLPFRLSAGIGGFDNPASWGIFSTLAWLAGITFYGRCRSLTAKWLWGAGMLLLSLVVCLSASRASWVALAVGGAWVLAFSDRGRKFLGDLRRRYAVRSWLLLGLAVLLCAGGAGYGLYALRPASVEGRFLIWRVIAGAIGDAPWLGHGALPASYMPLQAAWFARHPDSAYAMVADNTVHAFNEGLRVLFECGIVGLLLFAGLLTTAFRSAAGGDRQGCRAGGLLAAVMCFGLFGYPLTTVPIAVVVVIALAVIAGGVAGGFRLPGSAFARWGGVVLLAGFLMYGTEQYVAGKRADRLLLQAQTEPDVLSGEELAACYRRWRESSDFVLCYGKTLYDHALYAEALPVLQQAARLKPSSRLLCDLGDCHRFCGNWDAAEAAYVLASQMTPARILPHYRLFCLYRDEGMETEAAEQARRMLDMPVKVVNTSVLRYRHQARLFLNNCQAQ